MTIAPIPPPVYKIADFHTGDHYRIMTLPESTTENIIRSLDEDSLRLFYRITGGFDQISQLVEFLGLHRSTVSKKANELQELGLVSVGIKPGTEKKYRPTKIFIPAPAVSIDMIKAIADEKGIDLHLESESPQVDTSPKSTSQPVFDLEEPKQKNQPMERNRVMDGQEQYGLSRPSNIPSLGHPINSGGNPNPPKLPGLPEYDSKWPEDIKRNWMKAYTILLNKASQ